MTVAGDAANLDCGSSPTSSSLLVRLKASEQSAWERVVELYGPLVYRWCRSAALQAADAADVGQEVFVAVARTIGQFHHNKPADSFRAWLRTITRNKIHDFFKKKTGEILAAGGSSAQQALAQIPASGDTGTWDSVSKVDEQDENRLLCRQAIELIRNEFEDRTWQAFWRFAVEEQDVQLVAAELGITLNAVYLAKSRILRRLRVEFADLIDI